MPRPNYVHDLYADLKDAYGEDFNVDENSFYDKLRSDSTYTGKVFADLQDVYGEEYYDDEKAFSEKVSSALKNPLMGFNHGGLPKAATPKPAYEPQGALGALGNIEEKVQAAAKKFAGDITAMPGRTKEAVQAVGMPKTPEDEFKLAHYYPLKQLEQQLNDEFTTSDIYQEVSAAIAASKSPEHKQLLEQRLLKEYQEGPWAKKYEQEIGKLAKEYEGLKDPYAKVAQLAEEREKLNRLIEPTERMKPFEVPALAFESRLNRPAYSSADYEAMDRYRRAIAERGEEPLRRRLEEINREIGEPLGRIANEGIAKVDEAMKKFGPLAGMPALPAYDIGMPTGVGPSNPKAERDFSAYKNLQAARRLLSNLKDIAEAPTENSGAAFWKGVTNTDYMSLLSFGMTELAENFQLKDIADRMSKGEEVNPEERTAIETYGLYNQLAALKKMPSSYNIAQSFIQSLPYMAEIAMTGGLRGAVSKGISSALAKGIMRQLPKLSPKVVSAIAKGGGHLAGALAATPFQPMTYKSLSERQLGNYGFDAEGNVVKAEKAESLPESYGWANLSTLVSLLSEDSVGPFAQAGKWGSKKLGKLLGGTGQVKASSKLGQYVSSLRKNVRWGGMLSEIGEEYDETLLQNLLVPADAATQKQMAADGTSRWDSFLDPQQALETIGTIGLTQLLMSSPGKVEQYYRSGKARLDLKRTQDALPKDIGRQLVQAMNLPSEQAKRDAVGQLDFSSLDDAGVAAAAKYILNKTRYDLVKGREQGLQEAQQLQEVDDFMNVIGSSGKVTIAEDTRGKQYYVTGEQNGDSVIAVDLETGSPIMLPADSLNVIDEASAEEFAANSRRMVLSQLGEQQLQDDLTELADEVSLPAATESEQDVQVAETPTPSTIPEGEQAALQEQTSSIEYNEGDTVTIGGEPVRLNRALGDGRWIVYTSTGLDEISEANIDQPEPTMAEPPAEAPIPTPEAATYTLPEGEQAAVQEQTPPAERKRYGDVEVGIIRNNDGTYLVQESYDSPKEAEKVLKTLNERIGKKVAFSIEVADSGDELTPDTYRIVGVSQKVAPVGKAAEQTTVAEPVPTSIEEAPVATIPTETEVASAKEAAPVEEEVKPQHPQSYQERLNVIANDQPASMRDIILQWIAAGGKFMWNDTGGKRGVVTELFGKPAEQERRKRIGLLNKNGTSIEALAEDLYARQQVNEAGIRELPDFGLDENGIRSEVIEVLREVASPSQALALAERLHNQPAEPAISMSEEQLAAIEPEVERELYAEPPVALLSLINEKNFAVDTATIDDIDTFVEDNAAAFEGFPYTQEDYQAVKNYLSYGRENTDAILRRLGQENSQEPSKAGYQGAEEAEPARPTEPREPAPVSEPLPTSTTPALTTTQQQLAGKAIADYDSRISEAEKSLQALRNEYKSKKKTFGERQAEEQPTLLGESPKPRGLFELASDFSRANMERVFGDLRQQMTTAEDNLKVLQANREAFVQEATAQAAAQQEIQQPTAIAATPEISAEEQPTTDAELDALFQAKPTNERFTPISPKLFNDLVEQLKKTGLAKDVKTGKEFTDRLAELKNGRIGAIRLQEEDEYAGNKKVQQLRNTTYIDTGERIIDDSYEPTDAAYEQRVVYVPTYLNEWEYAANTDPIVEEFNTIDSALEDLSTPNSYTNISANYSPQKTTRLALRKSTIDRNGDVISEGELTDYSDYAEENRNSDFVKQFGLEATIDSKLFSNKEKSADELRDKVEQNIHNDIIATYTTNGIPVKIEVQKGGKYRGIYVKDTNGNTIGSIKLRIADHPYNPANNTGEERSGNFISAEISNTDKRLPGKEFHGQYGIHFNGNDSYADVADALNGRIREIIDSWDMNAQEFLRTPQGEVYGFVDADGTVYLDETKMNANTPIHEFGHLWQQLIENSNPDLYQKGVELVKDSPYMEKVKSNPAYSALTEKQQVDEAMAMAIGDKGELVVNDKGLGQQLLDWLSKVWQAIGDALGIRNLSPEQLQNMSLEEFTKGAVADLLGGKEFQFNTTPSELETIRQAAIADGTFMQAPNGKPTKLNEQQWLQVRTTAFKEWFGDWENAPKSASKVIDENGEPMVMYHGTRSFFDTFKSSSGIGQQGGQDQVMGMYFTNSYDSASFYSLSDDERYIKNVFLSIKNPFIAKNKKQIKEKLNSTLLSNVRDGLKNNGYDGLIIETGGYSFGEHNEVIAFQPNQIKSATTNVGTFSEYNPDIRYQVENNAAQTAVQALLGKGKKGKSNLENISRMLRMDKDDRELDAVGRSLIYRLADKEVYIKALQDRVKTLGGKVNDDTDVYNDINLSIGRSTEKSHQLEKKEVKEMMDEVGNAIEKVGSDWTWADLSKLKPIDAMQQLLSSIDIEADQQNAKDTTDATTEFSKDLATTPEGFRSTYLNALGDEQKNLLVAFKRAMAMLPAGAFRWKNKRVGNQLLSGNGMSKAAALSNYIKAKYLVEGRENKLPVSGFGAFKSETGMEAEAFVKAFEKAVSQPVAEKAYSEAEKAMQQVNSTQWEWTEKTPYMGQDITPYDALGLYLRAVDMDEAAAFDLPDRGIDGFTETTGMTPSQYIKAYEEKLGTKEVNQLWEKVKAATSFGLSQLHDAGLMPKEKYDEYMKRDFYIPQRGWSEREMEDGNTEYLTNYKGQFYGDSYNPVVVKAKGRTSLSGDPIPYIQSMGHSAIVTAEKNLYKQRALNLVMQNLKLGRANNLFDVKETWYMNKGKDADGNTIWEETTVRPEQELFEADAATRKEIGELQKELIQAAKKGDSASVGHLRQQIRELEDKINVRSQVNKDHALRRTNAEQQQHEVEVWDKGQRYVLTFDDERVANGINKADIGDVSGYLGNVVGKLNRSYAMMLTSKNPVFAIWNFLRDYGFATTTMAVDKGVDYALKLNKNIANPKLHGAIARHIRGKQDLEKPMDEKLHNFFADGAATGYTYLKDLDLLKKDIKRQFNPTKMQQLMDSNYNPAKWTKGMINATGNAFSAITEYSELLTRFSTYVTSLEKGESRHQAAMDAKNVTVNFNRKGTAAPAINSIFMFFNATVQGTMRGADIAWRNKKKFAALAAALATMGFLNTLFTLPGDDDEGGRMFNEFDRMQNAIIGGIKIPLPHFLRGFWGLGVQAALATSGKKSTGEAVYGGFKQMGNELTQEQFNPLSYFKYNRKSESIEPDAKAVLNLLPSVLKPIGEVAVNEDFAGRKIYYPPFKGDDRVPQTFWTKDAAPFWTKLSEAMLKAGGGDPKIKDKYSVEMGKDVSALYDWYHTNPEVMEHLVTAWTGGVGKFFNDSYKTVNNALNGEFDPTTVPILNRAVKPYEKNTQFVREFYELMDLLDDYKFSLKALKNAAEGNGEPYEKAAKELETLKTSKRAEVLDKAAQLKKEIDGIEKTMKKAEKDGNPDEDVVKLFEQHIEAQKKAKVILKELKDLKK